MIRAADAKEVGVENPAEETFRYPNQITSKELPLIPENNASHPCTHYAKIVRLL